MVTNNIITIKKYIYIYILFCIFFFEVENKIKLSNFIAKIIIYISKNKLCQQNNLN